MQRLLICFSDPGVILFYKAVVPNLFLPSWMDRAQTTHRLDLVGLIWVLWGGKDEIVA